MTSSFGPEGLSLCVGQAALSVLMLEAANYVQHYGLQRNRLENGRYIVKPQPSYSVTMVDIANNLRIVGMFVACSSPSS